MDVDLLALLEQDDARQLMHITYGLILQEKNASGQFVFRDKIYQTLYTYENEYGDYLIRHIQKHFRMLQKSF
jgi:hypothetical protein